MSKTQFTIVLAFAPLVAAMATAFASAGQVRLEVSLDKPTMLAEKKQTAFVKIGLTGFALENKAKRAPVNVASISPELAGMSGRFGALATGLQFVQGVMLTSAAAEQLGIANPARVPTTTKLPRVTVELRGRALRLPVVAVLGDQLVGPLANAPAAVFPLARLQAALDVDLFALHKICMDRFGRLAPDDDAMPLRVFTLLAFFIGKFFSRCKTDCRHRRAVGGEAHLGIAAEVSHENGFVHTTHAG